MKHLKYDDACSLAPLHNKKIAVLGYGSQGRAHSLNLRDSGLDVTVGLYEGSPSWQRAEQDGLAVMNVPEAVKQADLVMVLVPDEKQQGLLEDQVLPHLADGKALVFAHGFNIHFNLVAPSKGLDVFMIAPKGPGHLVRRVYEEGKGVPALYAVHQNATGLAEAYALAYAGALGAGRAGVLETTFREETETDLFGEQCVLCGGASALIKAGYETLVEAGYQKEVAYFECLHELKLIVDLLYEGGFEKMRHSISDTAEYGDYVSGKRIVNEAVKAEMKAVLQDIQEGHFAKAWIQENASGRQQFEAMRREDENHSIVETGKHLRQMMSWMKQS